MREPYPDPTAPGPSVLVQHALRGVFEIVELAAVRGKQEKPGEQPAEGDGDRHEEDQRVHASTRAAPHATIALDSGISTAATSGFTKPATAALTASAL